MGFPAGIRDAAGFALFLAAQFMGFGLALP